MNAGATEIDGAQAETSGEVVGVPSSEDGDEVDEPGELAETVAESGELVGEEVESNEEDTGAGEVMGEVEGA